MTEVQSALFSEDEVGSRFRSALERYGVWPTTIWPVDHADACHRTLLDELGDDGAVRKGVLKVGCFGAKDCYRVHASLFSPVLAAFIVNAFAPETGLCLDPFAGGGTRAIMAASRGLDYFGTELRESEVEAVRARVHKRGLTPKIKIVHGDAREVDKWLAAEGRGKADFLLTCPPYWNLERYRGGQADLSECATYPAFLEALGETIAATHRALKPKAKACWVVGLQRTADGILLPLHHDTARLHSANGFRLLEEVIVHHDRTGAIQRVGQFEKGNKHLVRVHEYLLVFERCGA